MDELELYDIDFYKKSIRPDRQPSYEAMANYIWEAWTPFCVVDYGCGCGWVLKYLSELGVKEILGFEPSVHAAKVQMDENLKRSIIFGRHADLTQSSCSFFIQKADVAICIEVAEHIPEEFSDVLIENIIYNTNVLVFSAAPPGQGGVGHINEQPWEYWEKKFKKFCFQEDEEQTRNFQNYLKKKNTKSWYSNNIRVLIREA